MSRAPSAAAPRVSVLLSSYNHAPFVQEAIDSVLQQSFEDFELIIIDDASGDGSWEIIERNGDPRIRAFRNETRKGAVNNANWALRELIRGEYVAIHHSDDVWMPEKLERQLARFAADASLGAVFTWVQIIDESGKRLQNDWFNRSGANRWQLLRELFREENHLAHPSILIRAQCYASLGPYNPLLVQTPDADMWCRLLLEWPIEIIPETLTLHRLFSDRSNTSSSGRADVRVRTANEWNHLRAHFLKIKDSDTVFRIFPALATQFEPRAPSPVKFLLAMACLHDCETRNAWQLGIEWLRDLMSNATEREAIEAAFGYAIGDLVRITGERDPFGVLETERHEQELMTLRESARRWAQDAVQWQEQYEALKGAHEQLTRSLLDLQHTHNRLTERLARIEQHPAYALLARARRALMKLNPLKHD